MMRRLIGVVFLIVFGLTGVGIIFSDAHLLNLCRRGCEANALVYFLLGNATGKLIVGGAIVLLGLWIFWLTWCKKIVAKDYYAD